MGTMTPSVATTREDHPTANNWNRSDSTPTSNSSKIAPISASTRSMELSRRGSSAVIPNRLRLPSKTPISNSPRTGGGGECFQDQVDVGARYDQFHLHFGKKVNLVLSAAVNLGVALLAAMAAD